MKIGSVYSTDDQRMYKKVTTTAQTTEEYYLTDAMGRTVAIKDLQSGDWEYYASTNERDARLKPGTTNGARFSEEEAQFFVYDHLGNTRITYTPMQVAGSYTINRIDYVADYFPYGKVLREFVYDKQEKYLTTQHERDQETGLDYRGARYYDSDVARFLSVDPLAMDTFDPFGYCYDNPVAYIDPYGLSAIPPLGFDQKDGTLHTDNDGSWKYNASNNMWEGLNGSKDLENIKTLPTIYVHPHKSNNYFSSIGWYYGAGRTLNWLGENSIPTRGKFQGATKGTSIASVYFRNQKWSNKPIPKSVQKMIPKTINKAPVRANRYGALAGRLTPVAGRGIVLVSAGVSVYNVATAENKAEAISREAGGWAGATAGAELGSEIGMAIGSVFPGAGTVIGGIIGGTIGGGIGYFYGAEAGETVYNTVK